MAVHQKQSAQHNDTNVKATYSFLLNYVVVEVRTNQDKSCDNVMLGESIDEGSLTDDM